MQYIPGTTELFVLMAIVAIFTPVLVWMVKSEKEECGYCGTSSDPNDICENCFPIAEEPGGSFTEVGDPIYDAGGYDMDDDYRCPCCGKFIFPIDECPCSQGTCSRCGEEIW